MTPKRIGYTDHARREMRARRITRQQVRNLIAIAPRDDLGRGDFIVRGYVGRREAAALFNENAERILVISVWWKRTKAAQEREKARRQREREKRREGG